MPTNIERLLRLAADYDFFCAEHPAQEDAPEDFDELCAEELDLIAAGTAYPADLFRKEVP